MSHSLCEILYLDSSTLHKGIQHPYYYMLMIEEDTVFSVEFTKYRCKENSFIFLSPYLFFKLEEFSQSQIRALVFHGDFYCIEYHKKEVACNGLLFNNIYHQPFVTVSKQVFREIDGIIGRMQSYSNIENAFDVSILKSYLQLILALSSKEKQQQMNLFKVKDQSLESIIHFQDLLDAHFAEYRDVAFYAERLGLAVNSFSKKIKKHFGKSPSKLIQERIVLEAKKLLHLTHKPVKEVAAELNFEDEFYFSRYFKKEVGISPKQFRERVGVSIVADLSM